MLSGSSAQADHNELFFAKPFSGEKTHTYDVELQLSKDEKKTFTVPNSCSMIIDLSTYGAASWGNQLNRNLWSKVINDCKYVIFLEHQNNLAENDFITDYDFYNAKLIDLPFSPDCGTGGNFINRMMDCLPFSKNILRLSAFFPFLDIRTGEDENEEIPCSFVNGIFRGYLIQNKNRIICKKDNKAPGLRLISIDYGDFNDDNYRDVLLRIMPLGRGVSRLPLLLPLSRFSLDEPFTVPQHLTVDVLSQ